MWMYSFSVQWWMGYMLWSHIMVSPETIPLISCYNPPGFIRSGSFLPCLPQMLPRGGWILPHFMGFTPSYPLLYSCCSMWGLYVGSWVSFGTLNCAFWSTKWPAMLATPKTFLYEKPSLWPGKLLPFTGTPLKLFTITIEILGSQCLPSEKVTYQNQKCPQKCHTVWSVWCL